MLFKIELLSIFNYFAAHASAKSAGATRGVSLQQHGPHFGQATQPWSRPPHNITAFSPASP